MNHWEFGLLMLGLVLGAIAAVIDSMTLVLIALVLAVAVGVYLCITYRRDIR